MDIYKITYWQNISELFMYIMQVNDTGLIGEIIWWIKPILYKVLGYNNLVAKDFTLVSPNSTGSPFDFEFQM